MVSLADGDTGSESGHFKRRKAELTPGQQQQRRRHTVRHSRKQTLSSRLSDSGFEEDLLGSSPLSSPAHLIEAPLRSGEQEPPQSEQPSTWYLQYGDVGFSIQREREAQFNACRSLARQPQLTPDARCKLVSWLIPVHKHFRLSFECCCLAVNIMDRFLASTAVAADCFQLLGVTALLLASKQVETCSPRISHLLSLCCDTFTKEQLCNLECLVLLRLNYRLAAPTLAFFLDYYTNCIEAARLHSAQANLESDTSRECSNLAQKVCELSLADYAFNKYPPSLTASCALHLAGELLSTELQSHRDRLVDGLCAQAANCVSSDDSAGLQSHDHGLLQECKDNLRLLVSLNQDTLELMSTM